MQNKDVLFLKIKGLLPSLNPALKKIAEYILAHPQKVKMLRIKDLASTCGVAEATVTRFVKKIGLNNFQELKINIAEITTEKIIEKEVVYEDISKGDSINSIIEKIVAINNKALNDTKMLLDVKEIKKAINAIDGAGKINIYGAGGSYLTAENARIRFYRIGKICNVYNDPNQQAVAASLLTQQDVAIGISNSGRTISTVNALKQAKDSGAKTICITSYDQTPIINYSDIKLFTSTQDSEFFQESMVSRHAQMVVIDILYASLAVNTFETSIKMIEKSSTSLKHVQM